VEGFGGAVWEIMTAAGGALALTFIVTIALGINALTVLFVGSAVVALEQFARVARRWRSLLGFGLAWAGIVGSGILYRQTPELSARPWSEWLMGWGAPWSFSSFAS